MRILIINTLYPPIQVGGAEKSVSLLAEALVRRGSDVAVVSLHQNDEEVLETRNGVRVYRLPLDNFYWPYQRQRKPLLGWRMLWHLREIWNFRAAKRVGRILDQEKPDVVHTNNLTGLSISVWAEVLKRRIRVVHTLRDYGLACLHGGMFRETTICQKQCLDCSLFSTLRRNWSHKMDAVVSNSQFVLAAHQEAGFFRNVPASVIYNIADLSSSRKGERGGMKSDNPLVFGFIGQLELRKGIEVVLKATKMLRQDNWRLRIAGVGLEAFVSNLKSKFPDPRIEWLGFTSSKEFYASIDVNIVPSIWPEPLPRTLIETFAAGRSAICARSGGTPEISLLGKVVEMYSPEKPGELAGVMDRAMGNIDKWRDGGFVDEQAVQAFSESAVSEQYSSTYGGPNARSRA